MKAESPPTHRVRIVLLILLKVAVLLGLPVLVYVEREYYFAFAHFTVDLGSGTIVISDWRTVLAFVVLSIPALLFQYRLMSGRIDEGHAGRECVVVTIALVVLSTVPVLWLEPSVASSRNALFANLMLVTGSLTYAAWFLVIIPALHHDIRGHVVPGRLTAFLARLLRRGSRGHEGRPSISQGRVFGVSLAVTGSIIFLVLGQHHTQVASLNAYLFSLVVSYDSAFSHQSVTYDVAQNHPSIYLLLSWAAPLIFVWEASRYGRGASTRKRFGIVTLLLGAPEISWMILQFVVGSTPTATVVYLPVMQIVVGLTLLFSKVAESSTEHESPRGVEYLKVPFTYVLYSRIRRRLSRHGDDR